MMPGLDAFFAEELPKRYEVDDRKLRAKLEEELNAMSLLCEPRESANQAAASSTTTTNNALPVPGGSASGRHPSTSSSAAPSLQAYHAGGSDMTASLPATPGLNGPASGLPPLSAPAFPASFVIPSPPQSRRQRRRSAEPTNTFRLSVGIVHDLSAVRPATAELRPRSATISEEGSLSSLDSRRGRELAEAAAAKAIVRSAATSDGPGSHLRRSTMADPAFQRARPPRALSPKPAAALPANICITEDGAPANASQTQPHPTAQAQSQSHSHRPDTTAEGQAEQQSSGEQAQTGGVEHVVPKPASTAANKAAALLASLPSADGDRPVRRTSIHLRRQNNNKEGRVESAV